jgi:hypothetical protein
MRRNSCQFKNHSGVRSLFPAMPKLALLMTTLSSSEPDLPVLFSQFFESKDDHVANSNKMASLEV